MRRMVMLVVAAMVAGACSDAPTVKRAAPTKVTVQTSEYAFDVASTFAGGLVEITLDNRGGKEHHELELTRVDAGRTFADVQAAMSAGGPPPEWAHAEGGPGTVSPGRTEVYTANLTPGHYVLVCSVRAADGEPHLAKGMSAEVDVTAGEDGDLPRGDATIVGKEFDLDGVEGLEAGTQVVRFENAGTQEHEVTVFALAPGKTVQDLVDSFDPERGGARAHTDVPGLVGAIPPGAEAVRTLELKAGVSYVFACFVTNPVDHRPHVSRGMFATLTPT